MIPRVIHQIWFGDREPPLRCMETWRRRNPDWTYRLWTDAAGMQVHGHLGAEPLFALENQGRFDWLRSHTARSDLARYEVLARFGGFYTDTDGVCLRPIDEFLARVTKPAFIVQDRNQPWRFANGLIACEAGHPMLRHLVRACGTVKMSSRTMHGALTTGPKLITDLATVYRPIVQTFGWQTWMQPITYRGNDPEVFGLHACSSHPAFEAAMRAWTGD